MPAPWSDWAFSEQADYIVDMFEGFDEEDLEFIYKEWEKGSYLDHPMGRTEALADLQMIARQRYLEKCGKGDAQSKLYEAWRRGINQS